MIMGLGSRILHSFVLFIVGQNLGNEIGDIYDKKYGSVDNENWILSVENPNYMNLETLKKSLDMLESERSKTYTEGGPMYISDKKSGK